MHFTNCDTRFHNVEIIREKTSRALWAFFTEIWPTLYTGYTDTLRVDWETAFMARDFIVADDWCGVVIKVSHIESHNELGAVERRSLPLRRVLCAVLKRRAIHARAMEPKQAVRTLNDTMGPRELVLSLLCFGSLPTILGFQSSAAQK